MSALAALIRGAVALVQILVERPAQKSAKRQATQDDIEFSASVERAKAALQARAAAERAAKEKGK